jgi:branched-chain amino acid transport system ATP-binding protein
MAEALLSLSGVRSGYGNRLVLRDVELSVPAGQVVTLIGPNGHGKTTLLRTISGLTALRGGEISLDGRPLKGLPPERIAALGVVHVPQGDLLFTQMTVQENLLMGAYLERDAKVTAGRLEEVYALLPKLKERRHQVAATLSGGERRMAGIARGLMAGGRILMLDEPSLGLAPIIIDQIYELIAGLKAKGHSILLVEENPMRVVDLAERLYLLDNGEIAWSGRGEELMRREELLATYFGA